MEDWFTYQGHTAITGSRDAVREAFNRGLVEDGEGWMEMIASRNQTAHAYNEAVASRITERITNRYTELFKAFRDTMVAKAAHIDRVGCAFYKRWTAGDGPSPNR